MNARRLVPARTKMMMTSADDDHEVMDVLAFYGMIMIKFNKKKSSLENILF